MQTITPLWRKIEAVSRFRNEETLSLKGQLIQAEGKIETLKHLLEVSRKRVEFLEMHAVVQTVAPSTQAANLIVHQVAVEHGMTIERIRSNVRGPLVAKARLKAAYRLRKELGRSYRKIARDVGRSDHTTARHYVSHYCVLNGVRNICRD